MVWRGDSQAGANDGMAGAVDLFDPDDGARRRIRRQDQQCEEGREDPMRSKLVPACPARQTMRPCRPGEPTGADANGPVGWIDLDGP